jgi:hypothetical protein
MKRNLLPLLIIIPGIAGMIVFGHYALQDWAQLQQAYAAYKSLADTSSDLAALFKANAAQSIQRINLFADGTWFLLTAIITAIGLGAWQRR